MCESGEWRPVYEIDGRVVDPGRLYQIRKGWAEPSPVACPNGHRLGHGRVLVGSTACLPVAHRTHTCRACGATIYTPPLRSTCDHDRRFPKA